MTLHIVVTAKQVVDPETPASAFVIEDKKVAISANFSPVINGYDEQAVEAALRIKEAVGDARITVLSCGPSFALDVIGIAPCKSLIKFENSSDAYNLLILKHC